METGEGVSHESVCAPNGAYLNYAEKVYLEANQQLLFFILYDAVPLMAAARNCLANTWPDRAINIGWVVADSEFLKSVILDDIPSYIEDYTAPAQ